MKILTHACCAPCAGVYVNGLAEEGLKTGILWYNPNIHPLLEYRARRDSLVKFAKTRNIDVIMQDDYGLREFVKAAVADLDNRCAPCYGVRLDFCAEVAKKQGYDAFSTTLLSSPFQDFDTIRFYGHKIAEEYGLEFIVRDFRQNYHAGVRAARAEGLYTQKYCGCIFSEEERYMNPRERR